jgi:hypothetical protein
MVKKVVVKETITQTTEETSDKEKVSVAPSHTASHVKKRKTTKKENSGEKKRKLSAREREEMLIENFVGLQHAMTNLSIKFGALSENISGLLRVFEEAARNFASGGRSDDKDMLKKINALLDQNKTIARGLVLMESKLRSRAGENVEENFAPQQPSVPSLMNPPSFEPDRPRPRPLPSI